MNRARKTLLMMTFPLILASCGNSVTPPDETSANPIPVSSVETITSQTSSSEPFTKAKIIFDLNGGTTSSNHSPIFVEELDASSFFFDVTKSGYNFRGWSYQGVKVFDNQGNKLSSPTLAAEMTFVAEFAQTAQMTIETTLYGSTREKKKTTGIAVVKGAQEYPYNTNVNISATPVHDGYVFDGWYYENTLLSNTEDYRYMMWNEDVTLEARFKYNTFTLDLEAKDPDNGAVMMKNKYSSYLDSISTEVEYDLEVTIAAYSKNDNRFLGWYTPEREFVETNAVYTFCMPNHDYKMNAVWETTYGEGHNYAWTTSIDLETGKNTQKGICYHCGEETTRTTDISVGDTFEFGHYEQDNDASNGAEAITWRVLAKNSNELIVISEKGLDCKKYNNTNNTSVTWETCTLRSWMNGDFYSSAFSSDEKAKIKTTRRENPDNPSYGTEGGNATDDKVWLLTYDEANTWFSSDADRRCKPTDYAKANGAYTSGGYCYWWLSTPGYVSNGACCVYNVGYVNVSGRHVDSDAYCVRPALTITI